MEPGRQDPSTPVPRVVVYENLGVAVVRVSGHLDLLVATQLHHALASVELPVVIDCAALDGIDSDGLSMLDELARQRQELVLRRVPPGPRHALASEGLTDLVAFAER
jgi:anti-anti-sigma regulatory factor